MAASFFAVTLTGKSFKTDLQWKGYNDFVNMCAKTV